MDIFQRANKDREEKAGLKSKSEEKEKEKPAKKQMSQADFAYGPKKETRPPMSKKWVEKGK